MITFAAKTDIGKERKMNQDFYLASVELPPLFILCDGMGGHLSGDIASRTAAESAETFIRMQGTLDLNESKSKRILKNAVNYANKIVYGRAQTGEAFSGMGTTMDICLVDFDMLYIAHVGDSRVYLCRDGQMSRLTKDHSLVEEMVESGLISEAEAENHPKKNIITRAVGTNYTIENDFVAQPLLKDDIVLMCSDGLSNMLTETEIKNILIAEQNLETAVSKLINHANENGGRDNITAIAFKKNEKEEA